MAVCLGGRGIRPLATLSAKGNLGDHPGTPQRCLPYSTLPYLHLPPAAARRRPLPKRTHHPMAKRVLLALRPNSNYSARAQSAPTRAPLSMRREFAAAHRPPQSMELRNRQVHAWTLVLSVSRHAARPIGDSSHLPPREAARRPLPAADSPIEPPLWKAVARLREGGMGAAVLPSGAPPKRPENLGDKHCALRNSAERVVESGSLPTRVQLTRRTESPH
ncbi:hypothetical protein B0J12DRAFT_122663 [Macrophomina phaseolina]|uniref:Uncharacterized protein n=1 Tax=Macrophomina phaseolina TaxID=35725 RepID=A0ABQ8GAP1_9PEZI|nr:hypothetical protein B0J12DRAFT_122663 [Macrophomina phaseolina]